MEYQIIISSDTPESLLTGVKRYWNYSSGEFIESVESIERKREILKYSKCILGLKRCTICGFPNFQTVNSRSEFLKKIREFRPICEDCYSYSPKLLQKIPLEKPVIDRIKCLKESDLIILKGIVTLNSKAKIYRHIFSNNLDDPEIWNSINYLQNLHLIWIERGDNFKIISFNYDPELRDLLLDF